MFKGKELSDVHGVQFLRADTFFGSNSEIRTGGNSKGTRYILQVSRELDHLSHEDFCELRGKMSTLDGERKIGKYFHTMVGDIINDIILNGGAELINVRREEPVDDMSVRDVFTSTEDSNNIVFCDFTGVKEEFEKLLARKASCPLFSSCSSQGI